MLEDTEIEVEVEVDYLPRFCLISWWLCTKLASA